MSASNAKGEPVVGLEIGTTKHLARCHSKSCLRAAAACANTLLKWRVQSLGFKHTENANNVLAVGPPFGAPQFSTAAGRDKGDAVKGLNRASPNPRSFRLSCAKTIWRESGHD